MKRILILFAAVCLAVSCFQIPAVLAADVQDADISYVKLLNMDDWAKLQEGDSVDKMEGRGSVSYTTSNTTGGVVLNIMRFGETALGQDVLNADASALNGTEDNLAVAFWAKIDNPKAMQGGDVQLSSVYGSSADPTKAIAWECGTANLSETGYIESKVCPGEWTWVTLPFSESYNKTAEGVTRLEEDVQSIVSNIHYFRFHCNTYPGMSLTIKIDDVRIVNLETFGTEAPRYDGTDTRVGTGTGDYMRDETQTDPNAPDYYRFLNCDSYMQNFELDTIDYKEGRGSVRTSGVGLVSIYAGMSRAPFGSRQDSATIQEPMDGIDVQISEKDLGIAFWMKLTSFGNIAGCTGVLSFGSGHGSDYDLYSFQVGSFAGQLANANLNGDGWVWVVLPLSQASVVGSPDLSDINFFYTHIFATDSDYTMTLRIDDVRLINCKVASNLAAPDYGVEFYPLAAGTGDYESNVTDPSFNNKEVGEPSSSDTEPGPLLTVNWITLSVVFVFAAAAAAGAVWMVLKYFGKKGEKQ